jgi:multiple sugar transport system substrate-binding protein
MSTTRPRARFHRPRRRTFAVTVLAAAALLTSGCTAGAQEPYTTDTPVTISFWHGWSLPNDLKALQANIDAFEKAHRNITVKLTPNVSDDKILQGLRSSNGPDAVSSFTATSVGALCKGALIDLKPLLKKDGIDTKATFIDSRIEYTQYNGVQCTLPLLGDALGLYYNTDMFAAAGITAPPKTWTEFTADAVKLTRMSGDSYDPLGFMPSFQGYESDIGSWMTQWAPTYFDANGKSNLANDPKVTEFFTYTKSLVDALGGNDKLRSYRTGFGEEFSAQNPFEVGKVAMAFDGEWRIANIASDGSTVNYAVAPLPVPEDQLDAYGKGFLTGTVIGISSKSRHQEAAWQLVKYLTTDTKALVSFGNVIQNLPSTQAAAQSPDLPTDAAFRTFVDISTNPGSGSTPPSSNGGEYLTILGRFGEKWEAGEVPDLHKGLVEVDKQIDAANAQSGG